MKIICTKKEFAGLIRTCSDASEAGCRGCVLTGLCGDVLLEESEQIRVEITQEEET